MCARAWHRVLIPLALLVFIGACSNFSGKESTYPEAETELRRLVDEGLRTGMEGRELPRPTPVSDRACDPATNENEVYPYYKYHFPLTALGPEPNSFTGRVAKYWETQDGFDLQPDDSIEGIVERFAQSRDFSLHVSVNHRTGKALVEGSGPCVRPPK